VRIGNNPLRNQPAPYQVKDVVCLVVTHLPCEESPGYHADRLEVVQTCLQTMRGNARRDVTFMVWDNDSRPEFRDWLQHIFEPDLLVFSRNVGKNQARANAIRMLPMGAVVAYSDDDILYYDNWLKPQLKLLNHFGAQLVTGYPLRVMFRWGNERTKAWAHKHGKVETGLFMPEAWERDYAVSIGRDPDEHMAQYLTPEDLDWRVSYNGSQAYLTGHHCQFVGYVAKIQQALVSYSGAMDDEKPFDLANDKLGLRLATTERLCRHMGNVIDDQLRAEISQLEAV
jgi:hypothetical protein